MKRSNRELGSNKCNLAIGVFDNTNIINNGNTDTDGKKIVIKILDMKNIKLKKVIIFNIKILIKNMR